MRACLRGREDGQAIVEMAFVVPVLTAVLVGILMWGFYFNNLLALTNAVGQGAGHLQQIRTSTTDPCLDTYNTIIGAAPSLVPGNIGLTLNLNGGANVTGNSCPGQASVLANLQGDPVKVTATYPCSLVILGVNFGSAFCPMSYSETVFEY
jgi:Flp pilus assembly protein TadG